MTRIRPTPFFYDRMSLNIKLRWQNQQKGCAPSEDSDQPGHPPSLIRVFAVPSKGSKRPRLSSCGQQRLWSNWAGAQADLSFRWAYMPFCWFCHKVAQLSSLAGLVVGWCEDVVYLRHRGVQLILAYSWARPAILVAGKGRGVMF